MRSTLTFLAVTLLLVTTARAEDTWRAVRPGVDLLHRTAPGPQDIWALRVDLSSPRIGLRASADNAAERGIDTLRFAQNTGALAAINADWSDGVTPVGLAIADGSLWHPHIQSPHSWGFFACTVEKRCVIGAEPPLDEAWWFTDPTLPPHRFFQAVGANGIILVRDGVPTAGCYDNARNPRSAICLDAPAEQLWLVAVDGRRGGAVGMTCDETRDLLVSLGCDDGAMLDGGGSTTLVVEGAVVNRPSDGRPRTVANHLAITWTEEADPRCPASDTRFCRGNFIASCQGGRHLGEGDCSVFGAACEEDGAFAYCVHPFCPQGRGQGAECTGNTTIRRCRDGRLDEEDGDCAAFGRVCAAIPDQPARCVDPRCQAEPNGARCLDGQRRAWCADGEFHEAACVGAERCEAGVCAAPPAPNDMGAAPPADGGAPPPRPDAAPPPRPDAAPPPDAAPRPDSEPPSLDGPPAPPPTDASPSEDARRDPDADRAVDASTESGALTGGCALGGSKTPWSLLLVALGLACRRRERSGAREPGVPEEG